MKGGISRGVECVFLGVVAAVFLSTSSRSALGQEAGGAGQTPALAAPLPAPWWTAFSWPRAPPSTTLQHPPQAGGVDYFTRRYEPAGFPLIGGNSDIGFEIGAVGTLSYFANGTKPYAWNMDLLVSTSFKGGPGGVELAQHSYLWQLDMPGLFGGGVRLNPEAAFSRTINQGYFGLGNASSGAPPPPGTPNPERYHEFVENVLRLRSTARVEIGASYAAMVAAEYRYVIPEAYPGSLLASDEVQRTASGAPLIYASRPLSIASLGAGVLFDTRDSEIFPTRGFFDQVGVQYEQGIPLGAAVRYGEAGAILAAFVPLAGPLVLAGRLLVDGQFGHVPFYDLFTAGPFQSKEAPGGSSGVRGVPVGRYLGPIKVVGNAELRAMLVKFKVLKQKISLGGNVFFDTGRVWSDYTFRSPLDGSGLGLKYGVGCGMYWLWGQAAIFRVEVAYSPDAVAENPSLPIGLYVEDGTMF